MPRFQPIRIVAEGMLWRRRWSRLRSRRAGLGGQPWSGEVSVQPQRRLVVACVTWMQESYWGMLRPVLQTSLEA